MHISGKRSGREHSAFVDFDNINGSGVSANGSTLDTKNYHRKVYIYLSGFSCLISISLY
jgi:hypothetical protein